MNGLPKAVSRQRRDCDLNSGPSAPESSMLTTWLLIHPVVQYIGLQSTSPLQELACCMGSHSDRADIPTFTPSRAGTRFNEPGGMQG